jgi:ABC-2 type transport system ATP-binding protein
VLEFDGLHKSYGAHRVLDGVSFSVAPGSVFGFCGSNGAGKTTTMRIAMGLARADAGEVRWRGRPLDQVLRRRIGYMPEERGLYPKMRVGEQLAYLARLHGLDAGAAARVAEHWADRLGLGERRRDPVEKLSLGNQQRVQLAAALVSRPEVLILDEPFSGLDPVGVDALAEALLEQARGGVPVVFSSHQLDLVERLCDAVGILARGAMVATGPVAELRRREAGPGAAGRRPRRGAGLGGDAARRAGGLRAGRGHPAGPRPRRRRPGGARRGAAHRPGHPLRLAGAHPRRAVPRGPSPSRPGEVAA